MRIPHSVLHFKTCSWKFGDLAEDSHLSVVLVCNFRPKFHINSKTVTMDYSQAFSLAPTGNWDGNDGAWSTFMIRVGTPAQLFRVLPATNGMETWIPIPDQCSRGLGWCGNARGVEPSNGASASPFSGSPNETATTTIDAGLTCTANRSPSCYDCISIDGKCTDGPCTGRYWYVAFVVL